jgi:hypothetical protein
MFFDSLSIHDFGAHGGGISLDTRAIRSAIDACTAQGGGVVYFPPGNYLTGTRFSNIQATVADNAYPLPHEVPAFPGEKKSCISVTGVPGYFVENITFSGIHITFPGGGDQEDAHRTVPELRDHYPEYHMFGTLPAYGMYIRHAKGITLENVTFDVASLDLRRAAISHALADGTDEKAVILG